MNIRRFIFSIALLSTTIFAYAQNWQSLSAPTIGWGSIDVRYAQEKPADAAKKNIALQAWRGEKVSAQLVVSTPKDLDAVSIKISDLKCGKNTIPTSAITKGFIGYVMSDCLSPDGNNCGERISTEFDSIMVADIIDHLALEMPVKGNTTQPIWLTVNVPQETKAGSYKGAVEVLVNGKVESVLALNVQVVNHVLPTPDKWKFHLNLWQNPYAEARYYGVPLWSEEHFRLMRPDMELFAKAGGKVITASIINKPWNGQTEDPFDSMITWFKHVDGTWSYDYAVFDKWVEFMMSCGVTEQINCFSIIPWRLSYDYFDQATNRMQTLSSQPGEKEFRDFWLPMLKDFAKHLKAKGWFGKTMISMDERPRKAMEAVYQIIKDADPEWKVSLAGSYYPELSSWLNDYCITIGEDFDEELLEQRKAEGRISTFYTCCVESHPNTFTFSDPAEAEWIGWMSAKKGLDGYLRWAFNSWVKDPMKDSRFRTWTAGDCYIIYPEGRTSIRFERLIDGIQSHEKIRILKDEYNRRGDNKRLKALQNILKDFDLKKVQTEPAAPVVNKARKLLNSL